MDGATKAAKSDGDDHAVAETPPPRAYPELLSIVSHDIRAPLGVILMAVAELLDGRVGALSDEQRGLVLLVRRSSERLTRLASNVQFMRRLEAGTLTLVRRPVDVREIAGRAVQLFERSGELGKLTAHVELPPAAVIADADVESLQHALVNVIANAVRFARKEIHVAVHALPAGARLAVLDDGPGIQRGTIPSAGTHPVAGLGLVVVRAVLDAHGGHFSAETSVDAAGKPRGARVCLDVPSPSS